MKNVLMIMVAICFCSSTAMAKEVKFEDSVIFDIPASFTMLTDEEIAFKFPSNRAPKHVAGSERRGTTIAWDLKPHAIPANNLEKVKQSFVRFFGRIIPGLKWIKRDIIELAGQQWLLLEMTSTAIDTDIHNIMLLTPHMGQMLVFNFNSTKEQFPSVEKSLRRSMRTIKIIRQDG